MFDASLKIGIGNEINNEHGNHFGKSSYPWDTFEEEYISRVKMNIIDDEDNRRPKVWKVEAKSIKSKLFDGLNSSWTLRESFPPSTLATLRKKSSHEIQPPPSDENTSMIKHSSNSCNEMHELTLSSAIWTSVSFDLEIAVSDPIIVLALDQLLETVAEQQVMAFEKRVQFGSDVHIDSLKKLS